MFVLFVYEFKKNFVYINTKIEYKLKTHLVSYSNLWSKITILSYILAFMFTCYWCHKIIYWYKYIISIKSLKFSKV